MAVATPGARFARRVDTRAQCRLACVQSDTEGRPRRAELRKTRPTHGPFQLGQRVLLYDQVGSGNHRPEHPENWRGLARVIGHEGRHGVWPALRGSAVLASPEHLAAATGHEVQAWRAVTAEQELVHDAPVCGGSSSIDARGKPTPPATAAPNGGEQAESAEPGDDSGMDLGPAPAEAQPAEAPPPPAAP